MLDDNHSQDAMQGRERENRELYKEQSDMLTKKKEQREKRALFQTATGTQSCDGAKVHVAEESTQPDNDVEKECSTRNGTHMQAQVEVSAIRTLLANSTDARSTDQQRDNAAEARQNAKEGATRMSCHAGVIRAANRLALC